LLFLLFRALLHTPFLHLSFRSRFSDSKDRYSTWFLRGVGTITEESARKPSSESDGRVLTWTVESLDENHEPERFFSSIPDLCSSTLIEDPLSTFIRPDEDKLLWALIGLMDRTSASHLVTTRIKQRRSAICTKAMDAASLPLNRESFNRTFSEEWNGPCYPKLVLTLGSSHTCGHCFHAVVACPFFVLIYKGGHEPINVFATSRAHRRAVARSVVSSVP
jgi:hypothetical protein